MNLRDLEYLVALAEHRHFGRAAEAVYVSQPTLSTQIKKLEAELGVELIERGSRQVMLTHAGERVVRRARHILADVSEIRSIAHQARSPHAGTLRLGAFPTLAPYLLPHLMPHLGQHFPELEVLLVEDKTQALLEGVRSGAVDAAFVALPVHDDTLVAEPVLREDFVLATPVGHALAGTAPVPTAKLAGEELLLLNEGHCLRDQILEVCSAVGSGERRGVHATSLETLRLMVASGVGVTLLPRLSVTPPVVSNPNVALTEFAEPAPHRDIALVWRRTHVQRELLGAVLNVVRVVVRELPVTPLVPAAS